MPQLIDIIRLHNKRLNLKFDLDINGINSTLLRFLGNALGKETLMHAVPGFLMTFLIMEYAEKKPAGTCFARTYSAMHNLPVFKRKPLIF